MGEVNFVMPPLNNMSSKSMQETKGLCAVRTAVATSFKKLQEEEKRIHRLFPEMWQISGGMHHFEGGTSIFSGQEHHGNSNYSNNFQVETTLTRYGCGGGAINDNDCPTHIGRDGKKYIILILRIQIIWVYSKSDLDDSLNVIIWTTLEWSSTLLVITPMERQWINSTNNQNSYTRHHTIKYEYHCIFSPLTNRA